MLDILSARIIAYRRIITTHSHLNIEASEFVILDEKTIEYEYSWMFFYSTRQYLQTQDVMHALLGGGPLLVDKVDGSVHGMGSAPGIDRRIEEYNLNRRKHLSKMHSRGASTK